MGKIPEQIKKMKPTEYGACEVRYISGKYYVYRYTSKWDSEKKMPRKVTGPCIGRITEQDGFIPNSKFVLKKQEKSLEHAIVKHYGVYEMFSQLNPELSKRIREYFPDTFESMIVLSLLNLVTDCTSKMAKIMFDSSSLSDLYPGVATSQPSVKKFIQDLGSNRTQAMDSFMRSFITEGSKLLFDGTTIFSNMDKPAEEIYSIYKERWNIEQCFDYLKNSIEIGAPYKRTKEELRGWCFINHLSLLYFYGLVSALRKADLQKQWTPQNVISIAENIYSIQVGDSKIISEVPTKSLDLLAKLGVSFN